MPRAPLAGVLVVLLLGLATEVAAAPPPSSPKVDPWVMDSAGRGETEFLVMLREQADLRSVARPGGRLETGRLVVERLREVAERTQRPLREWLVARQVAHRPFWVANMIWVRGDLALVEALAAREEVAHLYANPQVRLQEPMAQRSASATPSTIEWNVTKVRAPEMWSAGFSGQGVVVAGEDTGYDWTHPAIKGKYRGWNGSSADHNYNWHDAIHVDNLSCLGNSPEPCDDYGHGTHTMGTMVGDDGQGHQVGVAPGARWMGCRNMNDGVGSPASYAECFQWFIAPTDLNDQNPDPSKAPDVINNSWGCTPSEGCTDPNALLTVVQNVRAAGIVVVVSAGNSGSGCSSVTDPPAIYDAAFTVGATDISDNIAGFSSRGPVTVDGSGRLKPDVSAPGVGVCSSVPGGGYACWDGTSMAGPHVAGVSALLMSAFPQLIGQVSALEALMVAGAVPRTTTQNCGTIPGSQVPNNTYGYGRIDAFGSYQNYQADLAIDKAGPAAVLVGDNVDYTLTVTNLGPGTATDVLASDHLPAGVYLGTVTSSQGNCGSGGGTVNCLLGSLSPGATATVQIRVRANAGGTLVNTATVSGSSGDAVPGNNTDSVTTSAVACPIPSPVISVPWSVPPQTSGLTASVPSEAGHTYTWTLTGGQISSGQGSAQIVFTSGAAGSTMDLQVVDSVLGCTADPARHPVQVDFLDVPPAHAFHDFVDAVARGGITAGCGNGNYCPDGSTTRAQMAVFLLRSRHGSAYQPPAATGLVFSDVGASDFAAAWIEQLAAEGITSGCGGTLFCPTATVDRQTMAVLLLRAREGNTYLPPPASGIFTDVPPGSPYAPWIEELVARGVTAGCGGGNYCPADPTTRGQMAVFLSRTFPDLAPGRPAPVAARVERVEATSR